jgi:hypothetical protein
MSIDTIRIRELYPDFVKRLKASTKDFVEYHFNSRDLLKIDDEQVDTHLLFIKSCYYDDIEELEEIMFFTSSPFYEFNEAYYYVNHAYELLRNGLYNSFCLSYQDMLKNEFLSIEFKDSKFYFEDVLVPPNPYHNKEIINIVAFELITQVHNFIIVQSKARPISLYQILQNLVETDFVKNHDFNECDYYFEWEKCK